VVLCGPAKSLRQLEWNELDFEDFEFVRSGGELGAGSTAWREKVMVAMSALGRVLCSFIGLYGGDAVERGWRW
jgi:hypothetical protein